MMVSRDILGELRQIVEFLKEFKEKMDELDSSLSFDDFSFSDSDNNVKKQCKRLKYSSIEDCLNDLLELREEVKADKGYLDIINYVIEKISNCINHKASYQNGAPRGMILVTTDPLVECYNDLNNLINSLPEDLSQSLNKIKFIIATDKKAVRNMYCKIHIYGTTERYMAEILQQISEEFESEFKKTTSSSLNVSYGQQIIVKLTSNDIDIPVEDANYDFIWDGNYIKSTFDVFVPTDYDKGAIKFTAYIYVNGIQAQRMSFSINVEAETPIITVEPIYNKKAFVSYASKDRDKVMLSVKAMQKVVPDIDFFVDVVSLHCGEKWEERLYIEIDKSDVFYLFWSNNAKESDWVKKEIECALKSKGIDFIEPMPLETPDVAPPPKELEKKHFNDVLLNFIK